MRNIPRSSGVSSSERFITALDTLLVGTKEALWPVYATYCSCGDSLDPGKLSGPNLFTLLSKLGILSDKTLLSDVGILLYQISSHSLIQSPLDLSTSKLSSNISALGISGSQSGATESPSLSFEEFLVFLYAFSQLRFEGVMISPGLLDEIPDASEHETAAAVAAMKSTSIPRKGSVTGGVRESKRSEVMSSETWFNKWLTLMSSSASFRHLLEECILPILKKQTLLAFPEDARLRDKFSCVFSLEVLHAIECAEGPLQSFFESERMRNLQPATSPSLTPSLSTSASTASTSSSVHNSPAVSTMGLFNSRDLEIGAIMAVLRQINLVPTVINEPQVAQLIRDVMPEEISKRRGGGGGSNGNGNGNGIGKVMTSDYSQLSENGKASLLFPQWEWVLAVVAFQAVETAISQSTLYTNPSKIPSLVAGVITSIASAITQYQ
jgi:hypothetical protein